MAPPRTFDLDKLKTLIQSHPDWSNPQLAAELTRHNEACGVPARVRAGTVAQAVSAHRDEWEAEGIIAPLKRRSSDLVSRLVKNTGTPVPDYLQDQIELRRLRQLDRIRDGLKIGGHPGEADRALTFEQKLIAGCQVIDLYPDGTVLIREAAPWELDADGHLIDIVTAYRPPTYEA
jgi:hypothetical protein